MEVERHARARSRDPEAEHGAVSREGVGRQSVVLQQGQPLGVAVVTKQIKGL